MRRQAVVLFGITFLAVLFFLGAARPDEEIPRLEKAMGWRAGQTIADVGAGKGEFGFAAGEVVGESGRVYLTELDENKKKALEKETKKRGLKNIVVVQAAEKQTNLPDRCCDGIILRRVYHHFSAPKEMDASLLRSLKPDGILAVIEFAPRPGLGMDDVPSIRSGHGIPQETLVEELTSAGFTVVKAFSDWPDDSYCVLFRKTGPAGEVQHQDRGR